jgi:hypothetical protein
MAERLLRGALDDDMIDGIKVDMNFLLEANETEDSHDLLLLKVLDPMGAEVCGRDEGNHSPSPPASRRSERFELGDPTCPVSLAFLCGLHIDNSRKR